MTTNRRISFFNIESDHTLLVKLPIIKKYSVFSNRWAHVNENYFNKQHVNAELYIRRNDQLYQTFINVDLKYIQDHKIINKTDLYHFLITDGHSTSINYNFFYL